MTEDWHFAGAKKRRGARYPSIGSVADDLDAEAAETHVSALAGGEQADRGDAEVLEDLRAEPDLAPLP